jgi:hypothetical protein
MKMKKLKKIFSMALASVMALSMLTFPVSADNDKGDVIDSIAVSKTITVNRNASIPQETFNFKMTPATTTEINGAKAGSIAIEPGPALTKDTISYTVSSTDTSDVENGKLTKTGQTFDLSGLSFDHAGVYRYYIEEVPPTTKEPYIAYSTDKYMIDLYVYSESTGYKPRDIAVTKIVKSESGETTTYVKPTAIDFTNAINTRDLTIKKTVVGEEYSTDEAFDFWIEIPVGGDTIILTKGATFTATLCDTNGEVLDENGKPITYSLKVNGSDGDEGVTPTVESVKGFGTHFTLKNGQYLKICAPATMIYFVVEKNYSSEGYTQTYRYTEYGSKKTATMTKDGEDDEEKTALDTVIKGTVNTGTNTLEFINTREIEKPATPSTGINLNLAPYVLITLIAVCGGILFFARKRRVDR